MNKIIDTIIDLLEIKALVLTITELSKSKRKRK